MQINYAKRPIKSFILLSQIWSLRVKVKQVLNVRSLRGKKGATLFIANSLNQLSLRTFASVREFIFVETSTGVTIGILI
jgi:hypothetical protein